MLASLLRRLRLGWQARASPGGDRQPWRWRSLRYASGFARAACWACGLAWGPTAAQHYGPSEVLVDGRPAAYTLSEQASKPWRICALLPNAKDSYWWGVSWALSGQSKLLGVNTAIDFASGDNDLEQQRQQWRRCESAGAQAFVLASVNAEGLSDEVQAAMRRGVPVIDLINSVSARTTARAAVDFAKVADLLFERLLLRQQRRSSVIAWFPGPADAARVNDSEARLRELLLGSSFILRFGGYGPPDARAQATLMRSFLAAHEVPDFIVGNAAAVSFAARYFSQRQGRTPVLIAFGASHELLQHLRQGRVDAVITDLPMRHARLALDLALRALEKQAVPRSVSSPIVLLDRQTVAGESLQDLLPPIDQWMVQQPFSEALGR